ncbi:MAG: CopG family transcriptional regulator [Clostridiales bacterium]|nr:CopG family transcriptional regulator [Clostridiales bacterium]
MSNTIKIKKRGDDGYRVISVRIKEGVLSKIDSLAAQSNYSRNELINILIESSVENVEIEE